MVLLISSLFGGQTMAATDIHEIEISLDIKLPEEYKLLLSNYPESLGKKSLGLTEDEEGPEQLYLLKSPKDIIEYNMSEREDANNNEYDFELKWNKNLFLIGHDGTGGIYYINLKEKKPKVYFFHIADDEIEIIAKDLKEYIKYIIEIYREI